MASGYTDIGAGGRFLAIAAGLLGAAGVALAAVAAHRVADPALVTASNFLILHAAAALAIVAKAATSPKPRTWVLAAVMLVAGTALFSGDITARSYLGARLFPFAAPIGGTLMIASWLAVAFVAILELRFSRK